MESPIELLDLTELQLKAELPEIYLAKSNNSCSVVNEDDDLLSLRQKIRFQAAELYAVYKEIERLKNALKKPHANESSCKRQLEESRRKGSLLLKRNEVLEKELISWKGKCEWACKQSVKSLTDFSIPNEITPDLHLETDNKSYIHILEDALQIKASDIGITGNAEFLAMLAELKSDLRKYQGLSDSKDNEIKDMKQQILNLKMTVNDYVKQGSQDKERINVLNRKLNLLKDKSTIVSAEDRCAQLDNEKLAVIDYARDLNEEFNKIKSKEQKLKEKIQNLSDENIKLEKQLSEAKLQISTKESEASQLASERDSATEVALGSQSRELELQKQCKESMLSIRSLEARAESLQVIQDDLVDTIQEKSEIADGMQGKLKELKDMLSKARKEATNLKSSNRENLASKNVLERKLNEQIEKNNALELAAAIQQKEKKTLQDELEVLLEKEKKSQLFVKSHEELVRTNMTLKDLEEFKSKINEVESKVPPFGDKEMALEFLLPDFKRLIDSKCFLQALPKMFAYFHKWHEMISEIIIGSQHDAENFASLERAILVYQDQIEKLKIQTCKYEIKNSKLIKEVQLCYSEILKMDNDLSKSLQSLLLEQKENQHLVDTLRTLEQGVEGLELNLRNMSIKCNSLKKDNLAYEQQGGLVNKRHKDLQKQAEMNSIIISDLKHNLQEKESRCSFLNQKQDIAESNMRQATQLNEDQNIFIKELESKFHVLANDHKNCATKIEKLSAELLILNDCVKHAYSKTREMLPTNIIALSEEMLINPDSITILEYLTSIIESLLASKWPNGKDITPALSINSLSKERLKNCNCLQGCNELKKATKQQKLQGIMEKECLSFFKERYFSPRSLRMGKNKEISVKRNGNASQSKIKEIHSSFGILRSPTIRSN